MTLCAFSFIFTLGVLCTILKGKSWIALGSVAELFGLLCFEFLYIVSED